MALGQERPGHAKCGARGRDSARLIKTPNFDRLATEGVRLTDFRVPSALCTPSRGALLTGLYPPRTGLVGNLPSGSPTQGISDGIDDDEITLGTALRERGYHDRHRGQVAPDPAETTDLVPTRPDMARQLSARRETLAEEIYLGAKKPKKGGGEN